MAGKVVLSLLFFCLTLGQETKKEPIVLSDSNFEHLTQASTGATTGDWLVLFTRNQHGCPKCDSAANVFKILTERLSRRLNIAVVDCEANKGLERRFKISVYPSVFFFRHGFQFAYMGEIEETKLEKFVQGGYRNVRKEAVSKELSDFAIINITWNLNKENIPREYNKIAYKIRDMRPNKIPDIYCNLTKSHPKNVILLWKFSKFGPFDYWLDDTIKEIMVSIKERKLPSTPTLAIAIGTFLFCLTFLLCCCSGTRPEPVSKSKKQQ